VIQVIKYINCGTDSIISLLRLLATAASLIGGSCFRIMDSVVLHSKPNCNRRNWTEFMCEMPPLVVSLAEYIPSPVSLLAPGSDPQFWPEHSITALLQIALRYIGITQGWLAHNFFQSCVIGAISSAESACLCVFPSNSVPCSRPALAWWTWEDLDGTYCSWWENALSG